MLRMLEHKLCASIGINIDIMNERSENNENNELAIHRLYPRINIEHTLMQLSYVLMNARPAKSIDQPTKYLTNRHRSPPLPFILIHYTSYECI